jgi:hypothetical protein
MAMSCLVNIVGHGVVRMALLERDLLREGRWMSAS